METKNKNEIFRKLSEETREKIGAMFKAVENDSPSDSGTFSFVVSTGDVDRHGESIDQKGWDLEFYRLNPVVLWAHDYNALPIGKTDTIEVKDGKLVATGHFASAEANPFAQQVRKLYEEGIINTASVGLIAKEAKSNVITKAELLEWSFVPVPANANAVRLSKLGINVDECISKGLLIADTETKGEVADTLAEDDMMEAKYALIDDVYEVFCAFCDTYLSPEKKPEDFGPLLVEMGQILVDMGNGKMPVEPAEPVQESVKAARREKTLLMISKRLLKKGLPEDVGALLTDLQSKIDSTLVESAKAILDAVGGGTAPAEENPAEIPPAEGDTPKQASVEDAKVKEGRVLSEKNRSLIQNAINPLKEVTVALEELLQATQGVDPQKSQQDGGEDKKERSKSTGPDVKKAMEEWLEARQVLRSVSNATSNALENINKRIRANS